MYKSTSRHKHSDVDLYGDLENIKSALSDVTNDLKKKANYMVEDSINRVKEKTEMAQEDIQEYVAGAPFKSLGVAFFIGIALGFIWRK